MQCWYMSGAGNDFMVIDGRGLTLDYEALAKRLCAITGADGFMAVDHSDVADFRLHFYNSDGSRGEMCGNGSRCICRFAYENGIAGECMTVQTDAGIHLVRRYPLATSAYAGASNSQWFSDSAYYVYDFNTNLVDGLITARLEKYESDIVTDKALLGSLSLQSAVPNFNFR